MTPRPEKEPITRPSDRSRGRVLLIADDRAQFVETLNDRGIDVFGVSNGTAAIVSLTRTRQLVLLRQKIDRLRADADLDSLTGLANRRRFRVALAREVERWRRYRVPCALLMLDIDHLKSVNDKFGHPVGDMVIRQIAQALKDVSRDIDTAARLGGEEFALLLAGVDLRRAVSASQDARRTQLPKECFTQPATARSTFPRTPDAIEYQLRLHCRKSCR